ncbi:MAG: RluA family pseudouridine synthase [Desulfobacterales bacterium]|nr:RluA family pseudouridine synthase [Desulfobacterales bacterium]
MNAIGDFSILVAPGEAGIRLDAILCSHIERCSRTMASAIIRDGLVRVDGAAKKAGYRVRPGEVIDGLLPEPEPVGYFPEPVNFGILYEDRHLIVVDKPPGLVVHPAPGHATGTLVNGLLFHCPDLADSGGIGGRIRPGIVHRLDKDTSGILLVAKHDAAHQHLSRQFKDRSVEKEYLALVHGNPANAGGRIQLPIGRHPVERKKMSTRSRTPRDADTRWTVVKRFSGASLLRVRIHTGRTHQIRVHLSFLRLPVIGDPVYGKAPRTAPPELRSAERQMLHAHRITFTHPVDGNRMTFISPPAPDMQALIDILEKQKAEGGRED